MLDAVTNIIFRPARWRINRMLESYKADAAKVGELEEQVKQLDDEALKAKTAEFKAAITRRWRSILNFSSSILECDSNSGRCVCPMTVMILRSVEKS